MDVTVSAEAFNVLLGEYQKATDLIAQLRNELDAAANIHNPRNYYLRDVEQDPKKIDEFHKTLETFKPLAKVHRFEGVDPSFVPDVSEIKDYLWIDQDDGCYGTEIYAIVRFKNGLQGYFNFQMDNMPTQNHGAWAIRTTQRDIILNLAPHEQAAQTGKKMERSC